MPSLDFDVRPAGSGDRHAIRSLLPRLAEFDLPAARNPEELWRGDEKLLEDWFDGATPVGFAYVAEDSAGVVIGIAFARLGDEPLSGRPGAHLEVLAVERTAEGRGVAGALLDAIERHARSAGAESMTLNVFAANRRARRLYERRGYDGEIVRYIRRFG